MPKEKGKCPRSDYQAGIRTAVGRSMKISPEVFKLLRNTAIPSEFLKVAREFASGTNVLPPIASEDFSSFAGTETGRPPAEKPMPESPVEPKLEMPTEPWPAELTESKDEMHRESKWQDAPWMEPEVPSAPPEEVRRGEKAEAFYLTDLTLDLSGVTQITPGLLQLAGRPIAQLMFCRAGNDEDKRDGNLEEEEKGPGCDWVILTFEPEVKAAQFPPEGFSPKMQELIQLKDKATFAGLTCKASVKVRINTALNSLKVQMKVAATYTDLGRKKRSAVVVGESLPQEFASTPGISKETAIDVPTFGISFRDMQLELRRAEKKVAGQIITQVDQVGSKFVLIVVIEGGGESPGECRDSRELRFNVHRSGETKTEVELVG